MTKFEQAVLGITDEFRDQLEQHLVEKQMTKRELARRVGKTPAWITRALQPGRNLTIGTIVELAQGAGMHPEVRLHVTKKKAA